MTNDLIDFLLATLCLYGGITTMLFLLAVIDPQTDRAGLAHPRRDAVRQGPRSRS